MRIGRSRPGRQLAAGVVVLLLGLAPASAQEQPAAEGMPIRRVDIQGLVTINEGFVRRIIKTREGQNFSLRQTQEDVRELLRTRKFLNVVASSKVEGGQAVVTFIVQEKPTVVTLEVQGNKRFKSEDLFKELSFAAGATLDRYEVNKGREDILRKYHEKGYYYAEVVVDEQSLDEGRVVYRITEGPRVRVRKIAFEGARSFPEARLKAKVRTKTYIWIFRTGAFDEEQADRDAIELQNFYKDEGFLDARVGYRMDFDPITRSDLTLVFVIEEGLRYRIKDIVIEGNEAFDSAKVMEVIKLRPGDFLREEIKREDLKHVQELYGEIGYVDCRVDAVNDFTDEPGVVILRFVIAENKRSRFGRITVRGNKNTKDEVIRRELRFYPGEDYNTVLAKKAEKRLTETTLFSRATITPLNDIDGEREALVEVEEGQQVDFLIGFGVSTDSGVIGSLTINNRNFDLFGWPRTWGQFFRGQSFRGDGQTLRLSLEPGTELSRFRIDFSEPYLFDWPVRLDASLFLFQRDRGPYVEERVGTTWGLSRRFNSGALDGWAVEGAFSLEGIDIKDVEPLAAKEIREVEGKSTLTSVKGAVVRDTTDSRLIPTTGYRFSTGWEQAGALGGDYSFGRPSATWRWYRTVRTDIFDRKSVFSLRADTGFIVGNAPVFERYYAGGAGSLRGFDYRGISPRKGLYKDAVGGDFILLAGSEYSVPLYEDAVRGVAFLDMGTVEESFEISDWRVSVGFGLRINVGFFGGVPIIIDFGFPIAKDPQDNTRVFNFSFGASF